MSIEVMIADDHQVVREGIKFIIERTGQHIGVTGEASNGEELHALAKQKPAQIYIVDIAMPILNGIETTERLKSLDSQCKVIILSIYDDRNLIEKTLKCGAHGYLHKETATDEIVRAIQEVAEDKYFLSPKISKYLVQEFLHIKEHAHLQRKNELNKRERKILQLIGEGFNSKEIALRLKLSVNTVHVHRNSIMYKLHIHKLADLIRYALKEHISHL